MTPTNGPGPAEGNGSRSVPALLSGTTGAPPPDRPPTAPAAQISKRRAAKIDLAVLNALHERKPDRKRSRRRGSHGNASNGRGSHGRVSNGGSNGNRSNGKGSNGVLAPVTLPGNGSGDPDHPIHKRSRGAGLLPPDVRKRLQADTLPQVAPSMMRRGEWKTIWSQVFVRLFIYSWSALNGYGNRAGTGFAEPIL